MSIAQIVSEFDPGNEVLALLAIRRLQPEVRRDGSHAAGEDRVATVDLLLRVSNEHGANDARAHDPDANNVDRSIDSVRRVPVPYDLHGCLVLDRT